MGTSVCRSHLHLRRQVGFEGVIAGCNDAAQLMAIHGGAEVTYYRRCLCKFVPYALRFCNNFFAV